MQKIYVLLGILIILTACENSQETAPENVPKQAVSKGKVSKAAQHIEINGSISKELYYFVRVTYRTQNDTTSCTHYELFANRQVSDSNYIEYVPVIRGNTHSVKFTIEDLSYSGCDWSAEYISLCYGSVGHDVTHCDELFTRKPLSTIQAYQDYPPLVLDEINLECKVDEYFQVFCGRERGSYGFLAGNIEKRFPHEKHSEHKINFRKASSQEVSERMGWLEEDNAEMKKQHERAEHSRQESLRVTRLLASKSGSESERKEIIKQFELYQKKDTDQYKEYERFKSEQPALRLQKLQAWRNSLLTQENE